MRTSHLIALDRPTSAQQRTRCESIIAFFVLVATFVGLTGCQSPRADARLTLRARLDMTELSNDTFVGKIGDIEFASGSWYLCDNRDRRVVVLVGSTLDFVRAIGATGPGPGEISNCTAVFHRSDSVYVYDAGKRVISAFGSNGGYRREIRTPRLKHGFVMLSRTDVYSSVHLGDAPIISLGPDGQIGGGFGSILRPAKEDFLTKARNHRHLRVLGNGNLLSVGATVPVMEVYQADGTLLAQTDLTDLPDLREVATRAENRTGMLDSGALRISLAVRDVAVSGDRVFLLVQRQGRPNTILELSLDDPGVSISRTLLDSRGDSLEDVYCIAVDESGKNLLVFDQIRGGLFLFDLTETFGQSAGSMLNRLAEESSPAAKRARLVREASD